MSEDLIERLRLAADRAAYEPHLHHAAADELARLSAEVERLKTECQRITAESVKMLNEDAADYNRKTNAMIERHADQVAQLTAALADERAHADALAEALANVEYMSRSHAADDLLSAHRARRQG